MDSKKGPKGSLLFGAGSLYAKDPLLFFEKITTDYPELASFRFAHKSMLYVSDPKLIKQILLTDSKNYHKGKRYQELKHFLGNGLAASEGDFWKKQRKISQPSFARKSINFTTRF